MQQHRVHGWARKHTVKAKTLLKYALHLAVLIGLGVAGAKYINGPEFWKAVNAFDWRYAPLICLLGIGSVVIKAWRFATLLRRVKDVKRTTTMVAYTAGQSATLLPGGIAARAAMLEQIGIEAAESSPAVALSSISDQLGFIVVSLFCAAWFESARKPVLILIGVLAIISILLGIEAVRTWLLGVIEKILGKFKLLEAWREFKESMAQTLSWEVVATGVMNTLMSFSLLIAALWFAMKGVGGSVPVLTVMLAFALPTMLGRISALPGGVGVTEFGMTGILNAAPGITLNQAAAAVLIFRLGTVVFTALVGGALYWFAWRPIVKDKKHDGPMPDAPENQGPNATEAVAQ
jgi:uncharacterized protein (TIRG00374 family)